MAKKLVSDRHYLRITFRDDPEHPLEIVFDSDDERYEYLNGLQMGMQNAGNIAKLEAVSPTITDIHPPSPEPKTDEPTS